MRSRQIVPYPSIQGQDGYGEYHTLPFPESTADYVLLQLDAGQHAGYEGLASLPFYDDFDLSAVDVLLISQ